jgi:hypothetical protein
MYCAAAAAVDFPDEAPPHWILRYALCIPRAE